MSEQNESFETWTCDTFEEFTMQMVEPAESEILLAPSVLDYGSQDVESRALAMLEIVVDELLADRAFWEASPRTTLDAIARLKEILKTRIVNVHPVPPAINALLPQTPIPTAEHA